MLAVWTRVGFHPHRRAMIGHILNLTTWFVTTVERYLAAQERIAAALEAVLDGTAEGETEGDTEGEADDSEEADTWYGPDGQPMLTPTEDCGVADDGAELLFVQRLPKRKPS